LKITVKSAKISINTDFTGKMDPYVVLEKDFDKTWKR